MNRNRSSFVGRFALVALFGAAMSCSEAVAPATAVTDQPATVQPESEVMGSSSFDCTLGTVRCAIVLEAIERLESSDNSLCQQAGSTARGRYFGDYGGFHDGSGSDGEMYVVLHATSSSWSGYWPTDGVTYVNESLWSKLSGFHIGIEDIAGMIAHEEMHQEGWHHETVLHNQMVDYRQQQCTV